MGDKPQEFWLSGEPNEYDVGIWYDHVPGIFIHHVIEYSAYKGALGAANVINHQLETAIRERDDAEDVAVKAALLLGTERARSAKLVEALKYYAAMRFNRGKMEWMPGGPDKAINAIAAYADAAKESAE